MRVGNENSNQQQFSQDNMQNINQQALNLSKQTANNEQQPQQQQFGQQAQQFQQDTTYNYGYQQQQQYQQPNQDYNYAPYGYGNNQQYQPVQPVPYNNTSRVLSIIALVLSIISLLCCCVSWLFFIPAIICAIIALVQDRNNTMAKISLIISAVAVVIYIILLIIGLSSDTENNELMYKLNDIVDEFNSTESNENTSTNINTTVLINNNSESYKLGDTIYVHDEFGDYKISFTKVFDVLADNDYFEGEVTRVVAIGIDYENISYYMIQPDEEQEGLNMLYVSEMDFDAYDKDGNKVEGYPAQSTEPVPGLFTGESGYGELAFALNNNTNYIKLENYNYLDIEREEPLFTIEIEW